MKNWWISWWYKLPRKGPWTFELHSPWWCSGGRSSDGMKSICAAVQAPDEAAALEIIYAAYDKRPRDIDFRFVEARPNDWSPFCERFPHADWMQWEDRQNDS